MAEELRLKELPDEVPDPVYQHLIDLLVATWQKICLTWFKALEEMCNSAIQWLCNEHFENFRASGLYFEVLFGPPVFC
jgi:hypothetical protein